jgi:predicted RNase H-like HicB family nuclease
MTRELTFEVTPEEGGGFSARCREADIFTQGETLAEVGKNAQEAVKSHFFDDTETQYTVTLIRVDRHPAHA